MTWNDKEEELLTIMDLSNMYSENTTNGTVARNWLLGSKDRTQK